MNELDRENIACNVQKKPFSVSNGLHEVDKNEM